MFPDEKLKRNHVFKTNNNYYFYDTITNNIVRINEEIYEKLLDDRSDELDKINIIKYFNDMGFFLNTTPEKERYYLSEDEILHRIQHNLKFIILKITNDCNFRCEYCIYDGQYSSRPIHNHKKMSFDMGKRAIDYLFSHSDQHSGPLGLTFYGGEPLLNFSTIQKLTHYFKANCGNKESVILINTNGSLINERIANFLIDNEIFLVISLDGPEKIHDMYRKDMFGRGTYSRIIKNINYLSQISPEYVNSRVMFNITTVPPTNYIYLNDFFSKLPVSRFKISNVELFDCQFEIFTKIPIKNIGYEILREKYTQNVLSGNISFKHVDNNLKFLSAMFDSDIYQLHHRNMNNNSSSWRINSGLCCPGADKLFIDPDGDFYVCEKVDGYEIMKIGNIESGVDIQKVTSLINSFYEFLGQNCENCWVASLCPICFAHCIVNNHFDLTKKEYMCKLYQMKFEDTLKIYCDILEAKENAFD